MITTAVFFLGIGFFAFVLIGGTCIVPHQEIWVIQRLGKYHRMLGSGLSLIIPGIDQVAYRHSLKEEAIDVPEQMAITQDNVSVMLDGVVYIKVVDPLAASYGVKFPLNALTQLVQTSMRSEVGKMPLDKTFEERENINAQIVESINRASASWGIQCMRYEIKDIRMPEDIRKAMELQMTAERQKRARILESEGVRQAQINQSEGQRQAEINLAEGNRQKVVLESEAARVDRINRAKGEAEAILSIAEAKAKGIERVADALKCSGGDNAAALQVAEKYISAFAEIAKQSSTIVIPSDLQRPGALVGEALSIYNHLKK
jgi:regulator of protease activity HflC (stomatin/prohibitin superfamily)